MTTVMRESDVMHLRKLKEKCDAVAWAVLAGKKEAIILDAPAYQNSGDVLILQGEISLLRRLGIRVRAVRDQRATPWALLENLPSKTAVILHGGGNFGGLYPRHDELRGRILRTVKDVRSVLMMPQSVTFPDEASVERARHLYSGARGATFLVRDSVSMETISRVLPELDDSVHLCPDAAFATDLRPASTPEVELLVLARADTEARVNDWSTAVHGVSSVAYTDWPALGSAGVHSRALAQIRRYGAIQAAHRRLPPAVGRMTRTGAGKGFDFAYRRSFQRHIERHLDDIHLTISRGKVVITDRLHAHVAACLMGVPNVALNNQDGKVGALYREWTEVLSYARFAETQEEARAQMRDLRATYDRSAAPPSG